MQLLRIHSIEPDTVADREGHKVETIVVHTTDTGALRRCSTDRAWNLERIDRAESFGGISHDTSRSLRARYAGGAAMSDAVILCLIAASNPRRSSWNYAVASARCPGARELEVVEFVPPTMQAHHLGRLDNPASLRSIGIENLYPGDFRASLPEADARARYAAMGWPAPYAARGPDGVLRWYTPQPDAQYAALVELCRSLRRLFPSIAKIEGHEVYAPSKRIDPDPPVSLARLRRDVDAQLFLPWASGVGTGAVPVELLALSPSSALAFPT